VPPRDPRALAAGVRSLLLHPERRRRMGAEGARRVARRYTWQQVAAETETVYGRLLRGTPSEEGAPDVIDLREPVAAPLLDSREDNGREDI
jgi:hypothetical protein